MNKDHLMRSILPISGIFFLLFFAGCGTHTCKQYTLLRTEARFRDYEVRISEADENDYIEERSCVEILKGTTPVYAKHGYEFKIGSLYEEEKKESAIAVGADITGEGQPNLVLSEYTGGAHCCLLFHVFEIGSNFRHIQTIDVEHSDLADFKNLDGDPALELPMNDWTFAYWKTGFASSPAPEVILKYSGVKYEMEPNLMRKPPRSPTQLKETSANIRSRPEWKDSDQKVPVDLWGEMLTLIYTGNMDQAWKLFDMAWPEGVEGKQEFLKEFKAKLTTSPFWKQIKNMNK